MVCWERNTHSDAFGQCVRVADWGNKLTCGGGGEQRGGIVVPPSESMNRCARVEFQRENVTPDKAVAELTTKRQGWSSQTLINPAKEIISARQALAMSRLDAAIPLIKVPWPQMTLYARNSGALAR